MGFKEFSRSPIRMLDVSPSQQSIPSINHQMEKKRSKGDGSDPLSTLQMIRLCRKKQARLSNILTSPDVSISQTSSNKLSEQSIMSEFKFFKQSLSTVPETLSNTLNDQFQDDQRPMKKHFVFGNILGKGKYGTVSIARHIPTGFICAIKSIKKQQIKEDNILHQLIREIKIQSYCQHPNITKLYGYFADQTDFYLITELATEGNLYQKIKQQKPLQKQSLFSERDVALMIRQVCQGVRYLHALNVIHRDIKPENILIERGLVKICDFGWAVWSEWSPRSTICGTPLYISPQLLKGEKYDEKVDLWAIGILSWELFYGRIPFKIVCEEDLKKIVEERIVFPEEQKISEAFEHFLLKILTKNPTQRLKMSSILQHVFLQP